jgi:hypothetical protein
MRSYRATSGPFSEKTFFSPEEMDRICADELRKVGLFPRGPQPIRIDRFIEKRFNIVHEYADLPGDTLGYTKFGPKGVRQIVISSSLVEENNKASERRVNSTLAHESGHGFLHAYLFALAKPRSPSLFEDGLDFQEQRILCRKDTIDGILERPRRGGKQWWEVQANMAIGGLLMPRESVLNGLGSYLVEKGKLRARVLDFSRKEQAAQHLADIFDVNPIVARIRIDGLFPPSYEKQLSL